MMFPKIKYFFAFIVFKLTNYILPKLDRARDWSRVTCAENRIIDFNRIIEVVKKAEEAKPYARGLPDRGFEYRGHYLNNSDLKKIRYYDEVQYQLNKEI